MNPPRYTIVRVVQTSFACPSQWDAWTDTGQYLYLRYRHGIGTVEAFDDPDLLTGANNGPLIEFTHGNNLDGVIDLEQFVALAGLTLSEGADTDETLFTPWLIELREER